MTTGTDISLQNVIAAIEAETGLDGSTLAPETAFRDIGVESVLSIGVVERLEPHYGPLSKALLFEFSTIGKLAAHLDKRSPASEDQPAVAPDNASITSPVHPETAAAEPQATMGQDGVLPPVFAASAASPAADNIPVASDRKTDAATGKQPQTPVRHGDPMDDDPIAIIGMAGQFPQARNIETFWQNLVGGRDNIEEIPERLWDWEEFWDERAGVPGRSYCKWGGFLPDHRQFDPAFFRMSKLEAQSIDPQERVFLETVYHALEHAQYPRSRRGHMQVGMFVAIMWASYQHYGSMDAGAGASYATIANRASFALDLTGPSIPIDTMCSGSLTTLHMGAQSIRNGECEMAVVGGVNLTTHPNKYFVLSRTGFAARDGRCKPFAAQADGYVPSEGSGALVIKRLSAAERDGDRVLAVLRHSAVNHGGLVNNLTMPNIEAQDQLIDSSFTRTDVSPDSIGYVEAHAPGTALGDPIEVRSLSEVFDRHGVTRRDISIGSVKSNVGHLESAAGIASLVKVVQQMRHRQLVPSIHAEEINPNIDFEASPFALQTELAPWVPVTDSVGHEQPYRALINCFGAGGTNAHALIESARTRPVAPFPGEDAPELFLFSARTRRALNVLLQLHRQNIETFDNRADSVQAQELEAAVIAAVSEAGDLAPRHIQPDDIIRDVLPTAVRQDALPAILARTTGIHLTKQEFSAEHSIRDLTALVQFIAIPECLPPTEEAERAWLQSLARATQTRRDPMEHRIAIIASDLDDLKASIDALMSGMGEGLDRCFAGHSTPADAVALRRELNEDYITQLCTTRRLNRLGDLWAQGLDIDWSDVFGPAPMHVDLPLYPFDHEICWAPLSRPDRGWSDGPAVSDAPAIDLQQSLETGRIWLPLVAENRAGQSVQAQTIARMMTAVSPHDAEGFAARIDQWRDLRAVAAGGAMPDSLSLEADNDVRIARVHAADQTVAEIRMTAAPAPGFQTSSIIAAIRAQSLPALPELSDPVPGPGDVRAARFSLSAENDLGGILAKILSCCSLAAGTPDSEPMLLGHVMVFKALPRSGTVILSSLGHNEYAAQVLNEEGAPVLTCTRLVSQPVSSALPTDPSLRQFESQWVEFEGSFEAAREKPENVLIFASRQADANRLAAAPRLSNAQVKQVILKQGQISRLRQDGNWEIDLEDSVSTEACLKLVEDPDMILFVSGGDQTRAKAELTVLHMISHEAQRRNLFRRGGLEFCVVTRAALNTRNTAPVPSGLGGYVRTLAREVSYPVVQLDLSSGEADLSADEAEFVVKASVLRETERPLALRDGALLQEVLTETSMAPADVPQFRQGGHYLMFGGTGTVARALSLELARQYRARFTWVSRSALSEEAEADLGRIKAAGGDVLHLRADITDPEMVMQVCAQAQAAFGDINGLMHMTMTRNIRRIADLDPQGFAGLLDGKVAGTDNLLAAAREHAPDFTLLFSSIDVHIGSVGWSAYTAGCAYQMAAAEQARAAGDPVFAIGWGFWEGIDEAVAATLSEKGIGFIAPAQGIEAIQSVLTTGRSGIVVTIAKDAMLETAGFSVRPGAIPVPLAPPVEQSDKAEPVTEAPVTADAPPPVQRPIAHEWPTGDILGNLTQLFAEILQAEVASLDPDTDLLNYGVDSLIVVNIQAAMEERLGPVPTALLLENGTLRQIADALERDHKEIADVLRGAAPTAPDVQPVKAEPVAEVAVSPAVDLPAEQASPAVRVLRHVPSDGIEAFLRAYPSMFDDKMLDQGVSPPLLPGQEAGALTHGLVTLDSGAVEFFAVGQGSPVVMLSAVALTVPIWTHVMASDLARHNRLIVVHQPGYGLSDAVPDCKNRETAAVTLRALEAMGESGPYHILASCLGSVPAMHFAADFPEATASLALIGAFHDASDLEGGDPSTMSSKEFQALAETAVATLHSDFDGVVKVEGGREGDTTQMVAHVEDSRQLLLSSQKVNFLVALRYLNEMMTGSMIPVLERITAECLCLYGDADRIISPHHSQKIAEVLPHARLTRIDGSGHFPYLTHPQQFLPEYMAFLTGLNGGSETEQVLEMSNE